MDHQQWEPQFPAAPGAVWSVWCLMGLWAVGLLQSCTREKGTHSLRQSAGGFVSPPGMPGSRQAPVTLSGAPVVALPQEAPPAPFTLCEVGAAALSRRTHTHTLQQHSPERWGSEGPDSILLCQAQGTEKGQ